MALGNKWSTRFDNELLEKVSKRTKFPRSIFVAPQKNSLPSHNFGEKKMATSIFFSGRFELGKYAMS